MANPSEFFAEKEASRTIRGLPADALSIVRAEKRRLRTAQNADAIREKCKTLAGFTREAWHVLEPNTQYVHNWHIDAVCEHLEAVSNGEINRLLINIWPGASKSLLTSVLWEAWEWGPRNKPSLRYITTAFSETPVKRDTRKCRDLILSEWYQTLWPHVNLVRTAEMSFANSVTGTREGIPFGSLTSQRGDRLVIDDPHSTETAESPAERTATTRKFREGALNRLNDQERSAIVVMMQRLHEDDISGVILSKHMGYEHLMLPLEFEIERRCSTSIGFTDPRTEDGESGDLQRFPPTTIAKLKVEMGAHAFASQYQQRPAPRDGGMFKRQWFEVVDALPAQRRHCRAWDLAATRKTVGNAPDWTVGIDVSRSPSGFFYVEGEIRFQGTAGEVSMAILNTATSDPMGTTIRLPQDPGQAGKPVWEEELVLMGDGRLSKLRDVRVGQTVIGKDQKAHRVTAVHEQGSLPTVKLSTESGRQIVAALDHSFLTTEGWKEAGRLTISDTLALLSRAETVGSMSRTAEEFRLAGYFVGDGSVGRPSKSGKNGSCHAEFTCNDPIQLDDFKHCVSSLGGQVVNRKRNVQFGTKGIQRWLRETGLNGATAYTKRVPEWIFSSHKHLVAEFLGAYFACDGTVSKTGDEVIFYSVSRQLLVDVQHLLLRLGVASTLKQKNGKYLQTRHVSYLLRMQQQDDGWRRFANRVPVHHTMKNQRLRDLSAKSRFRRFDEAYLPDRIVAIEDGGLRPCRCLTVKDAASFVVGDFVVHNSQAETFVRLLAGYSVVVKPVTGDKATRANPAAVQAEAGNIKLLRGTWNEAFLDELCGFPGLSNDDRVDALSDAINELALGSTYDSSLSWVA